ncbi:polysaccharide pyruvyl transferase WcaK-like protein [Ancylobacter sp. 3268]|uniref:polysaccharide pyruvyl transferase family protein n=1 Tax=Ancylobacter sp. 3268 TaxID=2817752 RepID=UPI002866CAA3|nr:polysaccharide pyruvyl transferase family protein [Ancylobacter sp. 3268]MDR6950844.1 polysaccharide pyruvyl transferase WcaK-like protein [Ancylobacter sp. 3268]
MMDRQVVALCGTFDVANFGDLMFPIVAAARLEPFGWSVLPVSPTNGATSFADALPTRSMSELLCGECRPDAVMIGGGEIIHAWRGDFLREYQVGDLGELAYMSLWYGASLAASVADVPLAWNTPGVPAPFERPLRREALDPAVAAADYVSVRDATSRIFLGRAHAATVVPDTVAGIASVWPKPGLEPAFRALVQREGIVADARLMAVHLRPERIEPGMIPELGARLSDFARAHGVTPALVAIGPSLNDGEGARALAASLTVDHLVLDAPQSLREVAALLAHAALYVGNSMHGYVTAAAYDVPGVIVARSGFRKYQGFAGHIGRDDDVARSWERALLRAAALAAEPQGQLIPAGVHEALDRHWAQVVRILSDRAAGTARRAAFLRHVLAGGLRHGGLAGIARTLPMAGMPSPKLSA